MKYALAPANYSFNASAKTITFSGTVPADISNILHVANITRGVIYFQPQAGSVYSGTYTSPTLTLSASTTGHANGDKLLVIYDDANPVVAVSDNSSSLTVDGKGYRSTVSITRPSNTTQYTAGDVIGIADAGTAANAGSAIHTLTGVGPSAGFILLQSAALIFSDSSVISGMGAFRVHLYSSSPTAILDNAVFDLVSGDRAAYMGYFDLPTPVDLGSTIYTQVDSIGRQVKLGSASTSLFALIETRGTYTPASGSTIELRLSTMEVGL